MESQGFQDASANFQVTPESMRPLSLGGARRNAAPLALDSMASGEPFGEISTVFPPEKEGEPSPMPIGATSGGTSDAVFSSL